MKKVSLFFALVAATVVLSSCGLKKSSETAPVKDTIAAVTTDTVPAVSDSVNVDTTVVVK